MCWDQPGQARGDPPTEGERMTLEWKDCTGPPLDTMDRIILLQWLHHLSPTLTLHWNYRTQSVSQLVWISVSRKNNFSNIVDPVYIRSFMDLTPAGKISISDFIEVRMFYVFPREDTRLINLTVIKYLNNLSSTSAVIILNFSDAI